MGQVVRRVLIVSAAFVAWQALSGLCAAELVFLNTGRSLNVRSHRLEGDRVILTLRGGGEITCESSVIDRIAPDEVPYPEADPPAPAPLLPVPFADIIDQVASREGLDPRLVRAVIQVESAYQPGARSRKGAMGLMQLMPATAKRYAVADPYDPGSNIEAGIKHLKALVDRFGSELSLALAAYNAGEAAVERFRGVPPYPETQNYVKQVLRLLRPAASR